MSDQTKNTGRQIEGLIYRGYKDESDHALLLEVIRANRVANHNPEPLTLEDIQKTFAPSDELDPQRDLFFVSLAGQPAEIIGYCRLGWYSSSADTRLYYQISALKGEFRRDGIWQAMVRENDRRLREIANQHAGIQKRFFQAWSDSYQQEWQAVLEECGYQVVRRFNNMIYRLGDAPQIPLPEGFEIRPVQPEHMHAVWEAQREMNDGLFENMAENWVEERYPAWLEESTPICDCWQVAWAGDTLAGMVLAHIDEEDNAKKNRRHGYTEHIYVRPAYRKRGLAAALIARALQTLKDRGIEEAELGVDSENESAAFRLYEKLGYQTYSVDIWLRKPIE